MADFLTCLLLLGWRFHWLLESQGSSRKSWGDLLLLMRWLMTNFQKTGWTVLFSAVYMVAGVRLMQWLATVIYITPSGSIMHNLFMAIVPPINALVMSAPGGYLIYKIWKDGWRTYFSWERWSGVIVGNQNLEFFELFVKQSLADDPLSKSKSNSASFKDEIKDII